mmetsp:Transcript_15381/g.36332  ORF Transcript_15381/g.36332 Transcript_15381/m.36332 type:complete len:274 (+) Transcript_15381:677-1498(+)
MLGQVFQQAKQTSLRVVPGVRLQLLVNRLQRLDNARYSELVVTLCAVEGANNEVDNAEVHVVAAGVLQGNLLLFFFHLAQEVLGQFVLARHNITDTQISQDHRRHGQNAVQTSLHERLVVLNGLVKLVVLHEEHVRDVELPDVVLAAELGALAEDFLNHGVVVEVPVDAGHGHQDWNVTFERVVVLLEALLDAFRVTCEPGVLNRLGQLAQHFDVLGGQLVVLGVRLIWCSLQLDCGVQERPQVRTQVLPSRQLHVLGHHISSQVVEAKLAVQ